MEKDSIIFASFYFLKEKCVKSRQCLWMFCYSVHFFGTLEMFVTL